MNDFILRTMAKEDWAEVADLIYVSTNFWYVRAGKPPIFTGSPINLQLFCRVYEDIDPGCCILAQCKATGRIAGSCFYHPRETHLSLGIMNVHPNYFGQGAANRILNKIIEIADDQNKPLRLVSSALNLDSFSLYSRAGFVPHTIYQDMILSAPIDGLHCQKLEFCRPGTLHDLDNIVSLEEELSGISRKKDYQYFLENRDGIWRSSILEDENGNLNGFLFSITDPASNMLGPGAVRCEEDAASLIASQLNRQPGWAPVVLIPSRNASLVRQMYHWGARNCELHFAQCRGGLSEQTGTIFPTFMPETG